MPRPLHHALYSLLACLAVAADGDLAFAAGPVTVRLQNGVTWTGLVDPRSNTDRLWIRCEGMTCRLWRVAEWEQVAQVRRGQRSLSPNEVLAASATGPANSGQPDPRTGGVAPRRPGTAADLVAASMADDASPKHMPLRAGGNRPAGKGAPAKRIESQPE